MSRISRRLANRRTESLQKLIVFQIRQEWFAVLIQFAQKVVPLGLVYSATQSGISLTRYQDGEIPVIDIEQRVFGNVINLSLTSALTEVNSSLEKSYPKSVPGNQRYLMIVEDIQGALVGIPMNSPPKLQRVPKSAFSSIPAIYLAEGKIQCVSALITVSESEPSLFLLNLDQVLHQETIDSEYSQEVDTREQVESVLTSRQIAETRRLPPERSQTT